MTLQGITEQQEEVKSEPLFPRCVVVVCLIDEKTFRMS